MRMTKEQQELVNDHLYLVDEVLSFRVKRIYGCPDYDMAAWQSPSLPVWRRSSMS